MRVQKLYGIIALLGLIVSAPAQQRSIIFSMDRDEYSRIATGREAERLRRGEMAIVTPRPGFYAAAVFISAGAQWAYIGDADNDGKLVDAANTAPGDQTDALMVKRYRASGNLGPRDIFFSKQGTNGFASSTENGGAYRFATQGTPETFVTEDQIVMAIGQSSGSDINTDALCQTATGDLFLSFQSTEVVSGTSATAGAIIRIPTAAITYSLQGNVLLMQASSAEIVATRADVGAMIVNSGFRNSVGRAPSTTSIIVTALEIDPDGGTWTSPVTSAQLPNLVFAWGGGSNDGALLSTAGGGTIKTINGLSMGSTEETNGTHLGLLPTATGVDGVGALAILPQVVTPSPAVENWPTSVVSTSTSLFTRREVSNATPGGIVVFFFDAAIGSTFPAVSVPPFGGEIFGAGLTIMLGSGVADANGYVSQSLQFSRSVAGLTFAAAWQCFDVGSLTFGMPAAMQFQ